MREIMGTRELESMTNWAAMESHATLLAVRAQAERDHDTELVKVINDELDTRERHGR